MAEKKLINLVSGGAGFIGSHLVDNLMLNGEIVICLDDFSTGFKSNIRKWENHPRFTILNHDILNPITNLEVNRMWH